MKYYSSKEIRNILGISPQALYGLRTNGKIKYKEISKGFYKYALPETFVENQERNVAIYSRVSTSNQKKDLENQTFILSQFLNANGIIVKKDFVFSDIASGMNENREGLNKLLELIKDGQISKVYITNRDRLTRFGYGYLKNFCSLFDTEIIEINDTEDKSFENELTEDLIAIIHHFSMKFYGKRKKLLSDLKTNLEEKS